MKRTLGRKATERNKNSRFSVAPARREAGARPYLDPAHLSMALEAVGVVTWEWDIPTGSIRYSNNLQALVRGTEIAPYCSMESLLERVHAGDREALTRVLDRAMTEGSPFECEYRVRMLDGAWRWILGRGKIVVMEGGKPARVQGLSIDITDRKEAEENLRRSEALYRAIGESIDYGVWVCAPDGRNTYASDSFLKLVGLTQEQCSSFGWTTVLHPDDAERTLAAWKECCRTGGTWDIEHRYRGTDGRYHAVLARGVPVKNERGQVVCWAGINLDISRLRRAQEATRASEARFRLLADSAARLLATPNPQDLVNQLCREVMEYLGCQVFLAWLPADTPGTAGWDGSDTSLVGRLHLSAYAGISDEQARAIERCDRGQGGCADTARDALPFVAENIQRAETPGTAWIKRLGIDAYCCNPMLVEGRVIGTLSFGTAARPGFSGEEVELMRGFANLVAVALRRMRMRRALERTRAEALNEKNRLTAVMETLPVGVCILDAQGGIVRTNAAYRETWGGPVPPVRGVSDYVVYDACWAATGHPLRPEDWASARAVQHGQTVVNQELRIRRFDGTQAYVLNSAAPIRDADNRIIGCAVAIRDITERKQAEEIQRRLESKVQQAQKEESLGVLAGGIAHDFNNLLTVIMANIALASGELPVDSRTFQMLAKAEDASRHAANLCQQMLAYVGKTSLAFYPVRLNRVLREMASLVAASLSKNAALRWNLADQLPLVHADPYQLQQVVMNLLINASEAIGGQPGQISLTTGSARCSAADLESPWVHDAPPPGDYVFLEVADTGCGMEPSLLVRAFEPFFSTKFTGRGLGLAAVLGIVRSHHGTIQARSEPGRGSTFRVWLPALPGDASAPEPAPAPASTWTGSGTILVVDDEDAVRSAAESMLAFLGFQTVPAADGLEAVEIFRADPEKFWCVLLDATMPKLDGQATFQELVRIRKDVRVVLSSGFSKDEILPRFAERHPAEFLPKPYTIADLSAALRSLDAASAPDCATARDAHP